MSRHSLHTRLSGFYFFYFASLGALVPYWSVYLKSLSFNAQQIGILMAIIMATKIVSPLVWGWIADHTGQRMRIVRLGSLLSGLVFLGVFVDSGYYWLCMILGVFSFFWNATLPQFEATTFNHLGERNHHYSSIRLWGSIGFIVAVGLLGVLFDNYGVQLLPGILLLLFLGIWLMSLMVPEDAAGHQHVEGSPLRDVLRRPEVQALIIVVFLMQASHGPYYTFYTIYMEEHGYSRAFIGALWALGVVAEVGVFVVMNRLIPRFGLRALLLFSLFAASVRWLMVGSFADNVTLMIIAQCFHAATFGIYHAAAIHLVHEYFTGANQGRGQALYSSMSFGAGGAIGALISGLLWDVSGGSVVFTFAAVFSLLAFVIAWFRLKT